jgi:hypothetical protein
MKKYDVTWLYTGKTDNDAQLSGIVQPLGTTDVLTKRFLIRDSADMFVHVLKNGIKQLTDTVEAFHVDTEPSITEVEDV